MYRTGRGVERDKNKAVGFFIQACDQGSTEACSNLRLMYRKGQVLIKDKAKAATSLKHACQKGIGPACSKDPGPG